MDEFVSELRRALVATTGGSSASIRAASGVLASRLYPQKESVAGLLSIAVSDGSDGVQQLAAVELRKRVAVHWESLDGGARASIQVMLLGGVLSPAGSTGPGVQGSLGTYQHVTRAALCRAVGEVARLQLPRGQWADLIPSVVTSLSANLQGHPQIYNQNQTHAALCLVRALFDAVPDYMADHIPALFPLLLAALSASPPAPISNSTLNPNLDSLAARVTAVQALGRVSAYVDPSSRSEVAVFRSCVPGMMQVLSDALALSQTDSAQTCIEVFDDLLVQDTPLLANHIPALMTHFLQIASNPAHDPAIRNLALNFLAWAVTYQKTKIQRHKLATVIIDAMIPIIAEDSGKNDLDNADAEDDEDDDDDDAPQRSALSVISTLGIHLPASIVFNHIYNHALALSTHSQPSFRSAGVMCIAVIIDGVADTLRASFEPVMQIICKALTDPSAHVRRAGCYAVCQIGEHMESDLSNYGPHLLPTIFPLISSPHQDLKRAAVNALDCVLETLSQSQILPYLPTLLPSLLALLTSPAAADIKVKSNAVSALGSAAIAAGPAFTNYFVPCIDVLGGFLMLLRDEDMLLRAVATDTVGAIIENVGDTDIVKPYIADIMSLAMQGLTLSSARLRECTYVFFATMARSTGSEFVDNLPIILPHIFDSLVMEEKGAKPDTDITNDATLIVDNDNDDDESDDDRDGLGISGSNAISEEKQTSADALGDIFLATGASFLPYVERSVQILLANTSHYHENVRKSSSQALFKFLSGLHALSEELHSGFTPDMHRSVCHAVMEQILTMLQDEGDRVTVFTVFNDISEVLKTVGSPLLASNNASGSQPHLDTLCTQILLTLQKKHPCQIEAEDDDSEDDQDLQESAEYDAMVVSSASDAIGSLAFALGPLFGSYYSHYHPLISKYYSPKLPVTDRSMAIGCIAEVAAGLGQGVDPFAQSMLDVFMRALQDVDDEVRSNAAFGAGHVIRNATLDTKKYFMPLLQRLEPLFTTAHASPTNLVDNACGCVARMIHKCPDALPLSQVLPVLINALPLKIDFEENEAVYPCLVMLLNNGNEFLLANIPQLMSIFAKVLNPPAPDSDTATDSSEPQPAQLSPKTRAEIIQTLQSLKSRSEAGYLEIAMSFGQDLESTLTRLM